LPDEPDPQSIRTYRFVIWIPIEETMLANGEVYRKEKSGRSLRRRGRSHRIKSPHSVISMDCRDGAGRRAKLNSKIKLDS
jgi:hypothetical protein